MVSAFAAKLRGDVRAMVGRLVVLGLAVGVGVLVLTAISGTASTFLREMSRSYEETLPATATIELADPVDETLAQRLVGPGVAARSADSYLARFQDGRGLWQPLVLFVAPDLVNNQMARVFPQPGTTWPPAPGSLALERTAVTTFELKPNQGIPIRFQGGQVVETTGLSVVHDPAVAPAYQERTAYGYIDASTARLWGLELYHQVKLRLDQRLDWGAARQKAVAVAESIQAQGTKVTAVDVPPVHAHPHQGILVTLLTIFGAFGVLTVVLCSLLVSNVIGALIARERRWIGVMKTLGASRLRILVLFLAPVLFLGLVAVVWSVPLGLWASGGLTQAFGDLLNIRISDPTVGGWAWVLPAVIGLVLPLLLALVPVGRAMRMTILESLSDTETERHRYGTSRGTSGLFAQVSPVWGMAWRNTWRKKRRLALSLLLLGVGGGLFLTAFNVSSSWKGLVADSLAGRRMSYQIRLVGSPGLADVKGVLSPGATIETWDSLPAVTVSEGSLPVESTYPDEAHGSFRIFSLPAQTSMIAFKVQKGRWLQNKGEVVLNQTAAVRFPGAEPGSTVVLVAGGIKRSFVLAGVVQEVGQAAAYVGEGELLNSSSQRDFRTELLVKTGGSAEKPRVEEWLRAKGLPVEVFLDNSEYEIGGNEHFGLLITVILITGLVTGLVGWLGIASLLGLAVVERRREFGILRTLGATPGDLRMGMVAEAVLMTVLGTLASFAVAYPITAGLGAFLGGLSLKMPIPPRVDLPMAALWLGLSLVGGLVASLNAGAKASRTTIRETLTMS